MVVVLFLGRFFGLLQSVVDRVCEVAQDVDFLVHRSKLVKDKLRENPLQGDSDREVLCAEQ